MEGRERRRDRNACSPGVLAEPDETMLMLSNWCGLLATGQSPLQRPAVSTSGPAAVSNERRDGRHDEPNRTDHSACQSGARSCDRRLFCVVEPGSIAAPAAALALAPCWLTSALIQCASYSRSVSSIVRRCNPGEEPDIADCRAPHRA